MVKLHPFPSYQPLTLDLACLCYTSCYTLLPPIATQVLLWYEIETYTSVSAWQKIITDHVINLMTSSRDPCKSGRTECNFANVNKIWKMITSFINGTYLRKFYVNATPRSQDIAWSLFFQQILVYKLWLSLNMNTLFTHPYRPSA